MTPRTTHATPGTPGGTQGGHQLRGQVSPPTFDVASRSLPAPWALRWHPSTPNKLSERSGAPRGESGSNVVPTSSRGRRAPAGRPPVGAPHGRFWGGSLSPHPGQFRPRFHWGTRQAAIPAQRPPCARSPWTRMVCQTLKCFFFGSLSRQRVPSDTWCGVNGRRQCCGALRQCPTTPTTQPSLRRVARCHGGVGVERRAHVVTCTQGAPNWAPPVGVLPCQGGARAPHPGAVSTCTALGDTPGCNPSTTAALHDAPLDWDVGSKNEQVPHWVPIHRTRDMFMSDAFHVARAHAPRESKGGDSESSARQGTPGGGLRTQNCRSRNRRRAP